MKIPLTRDFKEIGVALDEILEDGPQGATNFAAAIQLSVVELAGIGRAYSEAQAWSPQGCPVLDRRCPHFPLRSRLRFPTPKTLNPRWPPPASRRRRESPSIPLRSDSMLWLRRLAPSEIARITRGRFVPVRNPGDIVNFLQGISFADIDDVIITNHTTGDVSYDVQLAPDGSFYGIVPVRDGTNRMEVSASGLRRG